MIEYNKIFDDNSILPFFRKPQNDSLEDKNNFVTTSLQTYSKNEIAHVNKIFLN